MERDSNIINRNLTRREFLKLVGITAALGATGCDINLENLLSSQEQNSKLLVPP